MSAISGEPLFTLVRRGTSDGGTTHGLRGLRIVAT